MAKTDELIRVLQCMFQFNAQCRRSRSWTARPGVVRIPATPLVALEEILPDIDLALIMSVKPGFSGQSYIPGTIARLGRIRQMLDAAGSRAWLEVDGGIRPANAFL